MTVEGFIRSFHSRAAPSAPRRQGGWCRHRRELIAAARATKPGELKFLAPPVIAPAAMESRQCNQAAGIKAWPPQNRFSGPAFADDRRRHDRKNAIAGTFISWALSLALAQHSRGTSLHSVSTRAALALLPGGSNNRGVVSAVSTSPLVWAMGKRLGPRAGVIDNL